MSSAAFEMIVSVLPEDIDQQNHVNNTVYLRWVQEVATAHWRAVATADAQENIGWVVLRHEIDYKTPACVGDEVVLRTWVGKSTRLMFDDLPKYAEAAMISYCQTRVRSGVQSMRKPRGQSAYRRKCASSFRFEFLSRSAIPFDLAIRPFLGS